MSHELYKKYRPKSLKGLVGQPQAVKMLSGLVKKGLPHSILLCGPSGCGKTTVARILKDKLGCMDGDFCEMNSATDRGIEEIRKISERMRLNPLGGGKVRVWMFDEAHQLTRQAQESMLKMLEDTPSHVYFILATTDPDKLIGPIRTRCTEVRLNSVGHSDLTDLVAAVATKEDVDLSDKVCGKIAELADGSPRKALVLLEQILPIEDEDAQLEALQKQEIRTAAFDLAKALVWEKAKWPDVVKLINGLPDGEDWEGLRRMMLSIVSNEMLKANRNGPRAFYLLQVFRDPWFNMGKSGLVASCYEVCHSSK